MLISSNKHWHLITVRNLIEKKKRFTCYFHEAGVLTLNSWQPYDMCARVCSYFPIICIVFAQFALLLPLNKRKTHAKEYVEGKMIRNDFGIVLIQKKNWHWIHSTHSFREHRLLLIKIISVTVQTMTTWNYVVQSTKPLCVFQTRQFIIILEWAVLRLK